MVAQWSRALICVPRERVMGSNLARVNFWIFLFTFVSVCIVFIIPIDDTAIIQIVFIKDDLLETTTAKS